MNFSTRFPQLHAGANVRFDISPKALQQWNPGVRAAAADDNNDIGIFDVIGEDFWTGEGVTSKRVAAALRNIGPENDVTVNINSPGGDLFEGLAIYSLLKEHKGKVTVKVLSLAASAASIIAMAGDEIQIARAGFFMIHNAWTLAIGNRHDLRDLADFLEPLDRSMADVYSVRTEEPIETMQAMMDAESWIGGSDAVSEGFADSLLASDQIDAEANVSGTKVAAKKLDIALAKAGLSRADRRQLLNEYKSGMRNAAGPGMHNAADDDTHPAVAFDLEPLIKLQSPF
ncbi:head maturation protease, ClpP-related [Alcanivorax sp. IL3]|uniref:head maturation protease, ClpP-related n=1 Tax=unclassified Alcanivorax TaxID=2638842 RepID=UPI0039C0081A